MSNGIELSQESITRLVAAIQDSLSAMSSADDLQNTILSFLMPESGRIFEVTVMVELSRLGRYLDSPLPLDGSIH